MCWRFHGCPCDFHADFCRKMFGKEGGFLLGDGNCPLHRTEQFTYIARPIVCDKSVKKLRREPFRPDLVPLAEPRHKVYGKFLDILPSHAQRRQLYSERPDAKEEVRPKPA